ncbi:MULTISPECIES: ABC transporter ATP-binding protein [unclassified Streptomyces]|uniref:ABC transporter ATP-binding protein n=1 Tax=unclassified Streptomyces TaxID=2593676 RepID=UPI002ED13698|nr:ABC transporter ATP-binding protein [Streptomyces sp. NBC_00891]WSY03949.1 ABC transporter ATP-binding protein [Streptomyces sp. NBC_00890]WSZ05575.1 ABC transporter ATP-binding protein [Streptomyces sp. NBC_00869]WSZ26929.1 ABC transporter ATP-binding protein [Streptomyces sp. NBC_00870]
MIETTTDIGTGTAVRAEGLHREYGRGAAAVRALRGVSVGFAPGTFTAVMGPSGSGKTTLLHCLAGMDRPTRGSVHWGGTEVSRLPERRLAVLRRSRVGFVFQAFNLMPAMTAAQNVALPSRLAGERPDRDRVRDALARVGLAGRERHRPAQLSGGQQQRVAIARALVSRPAMLFADEPTGALDRATGHEILALLRAGVDTDGGTCVMVTHDPVAAGYADRVLLLADGEVVDELDRPTAAEVGERLNRLGGEAR